MDRRGEGFAGVAVDLFTSGESAVAAVADVARRRASLAAVVAGASRDGMAVVSWGALARRPALVADFDHLVAIDPPRGGAGDPLLALGPRAHLAWGPGEIEFALQVWRAEFELRPALTEAFRALRALGAEAPGAALAGALRGSGAYPRSPECCGRLLRVLDELGLVELELDSMSPRAGRATACAPISSSRRPTAPTASGVSAAESALGVSEPARAAEPAMRQAS